MADGLRIDPGPGLEQLDLLLLGASNALRDCLAAELKLDMEYVLESAKQIVPRDTGLLESSGEVVGPEIDSDGVVVSVQFGVNPPVFYAEDQHENLSYAHRDGRQAKYLELPMLEWLSEGGPAGIIARCGARMNRGGGGGFLRGGGRV